MAKSFLTHINLNKNELRNAVIQPLAAAPSSPTEGQIYYNTVDDTIYVWANGAWLDLGIQGGGSGTVESVVPGTNVTVDNTDPANPIVSVDLSGKQDHSGNLDAVAGGQIGDAETWPTNVYMPTGAPIKYRNVESVDADAITHSADKLRLHSLGAGVLFLSFGTGAGDGSTLASLSNTGDFNVTGNATANNLSGTNTGDQDLSGYVPNTRSVNGHALSANVTVTKSDVSLGNVTNDAQLKAADLDTDSTLSANSDTKIPSQKAVKTAIAAAVTGLLEFKGSTDASANPNYPAASKGDAYVITVAGKIGGSSGKSVDVGDMYVAIADNAGGTEASVGTSWSVLEHNLVGALLGSNNLSDVGSAATAFANIKQAATDTATGVVELATPTETETKSDTVRAVTPADLANFPIKKTFTVGDNSSTSIDCTHSLGTKDVQTQVRLASDDSVVECDIVNATTNKVTLSFAVAPATNALKVVVIG